jgi:hypothetical protein
MDMIIVWALSWWYGAGWKSRLAEIMEQLESSYDYFSIGLLAKTFFAPFRQISAGRVRGPLDVQVRAFFDRLISRVIGSVVRSVLIVIGIAWLIVQTGVGILTLAIWPVVPALPFIGFIAMIAGWVPVWR